MANLDDVVQITISRESTAIATASFQIPLILATFTNFSERTRVYNNLDSVADDFASASSVYVIASKLFGQSSVGAVPPSIVVGRRQVDSVTIVPNPVADNTEYTVTINDIPYSFTSGTSATATTITAGLDTAIGTPSGITATAAAGVLTVGVTTPGTAWSITTSSNLTATVVTPTETYVDALTAVENENDTWYGVVLDTHAPAIVDPFSAAIQARRKLFGTSTSDATAVATTQTDIAAILSNRDDDRTYGVYLPTADTEYPEAAWMGSQMPYTPGSNDWDFKRAVGVTRAVLTPTQITNLRNKDCNFFTTKAGVNVFQDGDTFGGSPIDEIIGVDWLYARLQEGIFGRLIRSLKVPMTNPGLAIIENEIRAVLSQAEANGLIDRGWTVSTPDVLDIPENLRAQRTAGTFVFRARLQGSIRKVIIEGFLSV